jgi:hypothetical protein
MFIDRVNGIEGRVEIKGLRAVVGMFIRWSLERRGESQSGDPTWTLHAALSYQKDSLLLNQRLTKRYFVKLNSEKSYEVVPLDGVPLVVEGNNLTIEGVTLCPVPPPSPK